MDRSRRVGALAARVNVISLALAVTSVSYRADARLDLVLQLAAVRH